ncbi:MAG: hypothetical protein IBX56_12760 [Methylomicrobium sp.]|nr:hypothetical protein [Methylomicrobium sp.]
MSAMDGVNVDFAGAKIDRTPHAPPQALSKFEVRKVSLTKEEKLARMFRYFLEILHGLHLLHG